MIGKGTQEASRSVSPKKPTTSTPAPAKIEAPISSGKLNCPPRPRIKMMKKRLPVRRSG
jgi:hypothetical protein